MEQPRGPLVSADWLGPHLADQDLVVLDVRWALPAGADRAAYREGHIPGACFIDLDQELAEPPGTAGRHPLPTPERFTAAMRRAGVSAVSRVVAYDGGSGAAARAWWLLRAAGHPRALVLDGGLAAWIAGGGALEAGEVGAEPGDFIADGFGGWVSGDETAALLESGAPVLDARSRERFQGQPSALDPRPGHLPGASNLPWTDAYREGRALPAQELRSLAEQAVRGGLPQVVYCGSGITACSLILALEAAGISGARLYSGSYSEWAQDPRRPVELGESLTPGD